MNNQTTLNKFFKITSNSSNQMESKRKNKYNLSLTKTPRKSPKLSLENKNVDNLIDLTSDDEEGSMCSETTKLDQSQTSSSESTLVYTPETIRKNPLTPSSNEEHSIKLSLTPSSTQKSLNKSSPRLQSPFTTRKYYSPTKKRNIALRTPNKAKRNLSYTLGKCTNQNIFNNEDFIQASKDLDDTTIFLLKIIYQFLSNDNLKPLLGESSCNLLSRGMQVKKPGMRLVCRLYWQLEGWRRLDKVKKIMKGKLNVDEQNMQEAIDSLLENGFISVTNSDNDQCETLTFDELVKMLTQNELKEICKYLKIKTIKKADAAESLKSYCYSKSNITNYFIGSKSINEDRVLKLLKSKVGPCYQLTDEARNTLKELYTLMYLGINYSIIKEKKLELMLINDKANRETYPIDKDMEVDDASVVFKNREKFLSYMNAGSLYEDIEETTEVSKKCEKIERVHVLYNDMSEEEMMSYIAMPAWLRRYTSAYIYVKIMEAGVQELKKVKQYIDLAVDILSTLIRQTAFRQHKKADWYSEKALVLDKLLGLPEEAAAVLLEGFNSNLPEQLKDFMRPRAKLLARRQTCPISSALKEQLLSRADKYDILEKNIKAVHIYKQPMYTGGRGKIKFETRTADGLLVHEAEEYCLYHYIQQGRYTGGGHWEGRLVTTIFFLLFWDIIYAPLKGVRGIFLSHYQMYPLDMFCEEFYNNRKVLIEERLKEIEESTSEELLSRIETAWDSRPETEQSGVQRAVGREALLAAAARLSPVRAALLCRRLAAHYAHAHCGFPDLTLWGRDQITFVEVKTDSDKPSMKQIQWMHYMKQHGISTEFCYVGVHSARARARNTRGLGD